MLGAGLKLVINEAAEAQRVQAQTNAVLKSTGFAAGMTAKEIERLAAAMQTQTIYADEDVQAMENVLLTFTALTKDVMPQATSIVLDMATALGSDLQGTAIQVGKALQDPILGITALRRVGVNFNTEQTAVIKNLVETGQAAQAQALILKELNAEFGGSAAAQAGTYSGQMLQLKNSLLDLAEAAGTADIAGRSLIEWLGDAAEAAKYLITRDAQVADVLHEHNEEMLKTSGSYEAYIDEMLRASTVSGDLNDYYTEMVRTLLLTGKGSMDTRQQLEGLDIATRGAYNAAKIYDDRLESVRARLGSAGGAAEAVGAELKDLTANQLLAAAAQEYIAHGDTAYYDSLMAQYHALRLNNEELQKTMEWLERLDGMTANMSVILHRSVTGQDVGLLDQLTGAGGGGGGGGGGSNLEHVYDRDKKKWYWHNLLTGAYTPGQHGLDFVVPPGYPNDSYRMGVQSGEHVKVTPAGQSGGGGPHTVINGLVINDRMETQALKQRLGDWLRG